MPLLFNTFFDETIFNPDSESPPDHETTLIEVNLDAVPDGSEFGELTVALSAPTAETLAWNAAPTGTYSATSLSFQAREQFTVDSLGNWAVDGIGDGSVSTASGAYRPKVVGDDPSNYKIKIGYTGFSGSGTISMLGGAVLNTWGNLTGGEGIRLTDEATGTSSCLVTVVVEEIGNPTNSISATFTLSADGSPPI